MRFSSPAPLFYPPHYTIKDTKNNPKITPDLGHKKNIKQRVQFSNSKEFSCT